MLLLLYGALRVMKNVNEDLVRKLESHLFPKKEK